jgi:hypothetical protein
MTFEEWIKDKGAVDAIYTKDQIENIAYMGWNARQAEIDRLNALLDVVCPERNCPVTYRRVHEGKGVIFAVHGTSSNSYADALEARIETLEQDLESAYEDLAGEDI